jgi:hypothetical protein
MCFICAVSKCNIKSTKIKDILKHAEAISSKHKITKLGTLSLIPSNPPLIYQCSRKKLNVT